VSAVADGTMTSVDIATQPVIATALTRTC